MIHTVKIDNSTLSGNNYYRENPEFDNPAVAEATPFEIPEGYMTGGEL